ncbi:urease subunit beta [Streptomyces sp. TRM 70351]|uniref:urease subunit beta n=1 Tax=Streptomyces sp. TRM 70351 TaxID=3116552 RepID=UPI002E7B9216|nr:urease subunit beta [Streptomyces sp. TRM 70351]MEE1928788.1 urease subunit beta [Streptomyces sp. TRM 70351]
MTVPGEWLLSDEPVEINTGRRTARMKVRNTGDRPVQVGSHFHFFEVNQALDFDRTQALGMRLNVPAGQAIRFEPGDERDVELVDFGGTRRVTGFNGLVDGAVTARRTAERARARAAEYGFTGEDGPGAGHPGTASSETAEDRR